MGREARLNPNVALKAKVRAYVREHPEVAQALYEKRVNDVPLPQGTILRAIEAVTKDADASR